MLKYGYNVSNHEWVVLNGDDSENLYYIIFSDFYNLHY